MKRTAVVIEGAGVGAVHGLRVPGPGSRVPGPGSPLRYPVRRQPPASLGRLFLWSGQTSDGRESPGVSRRAPSWKR